MATVQKTGHIREQWYISFGDIIINAENHLALTCYNAEVALCPCNPLDFTQNLFSICPVS